MKQLAPLALVLAVLALGLYLVLETDLEDGGELTPAGPPTATTPETPAPSLPGLEAGSSDLYSDAALDVDRQAVASEADAAEAEVAEGGAIVRGRFLLPGGVPAEGASLHLRGWVGNSSRAAEHGVPEDWTDPTCETDAEGRFELRLDPPRAFQFILEANLEGYAEESWRWNELGLAETRDVGTLTLRPTGSIEGRIVDERGASTGLHFSVRGEGGPNSDFETGRRPSGARGELDPGTGHFRIDGLPPGMVELTARHSLAGSLESVRVQVRPGQVTEQNLVYRGPDVSGRLEVTVSVARYPGIRLDHPPIRLLGPGYDSDLDAVGPTWIERGGRYVFEGLEPGSYTAHVEVEGYTPYVREGLEPGSRVGLGLTPTPRLTLALNDAATGLPIDAARVSILLLSQTPYNNSVYPLHEGPLPEDGVLRPVPAGDLDLTVQVEGYTDLLLEVRSLGPLETRALVGSMAPASSLRGRVLWSDGRPAEAVTVQAMAAGQPPVLVPEHVSSSFPFELPRVATTTGRDGSFELPGLEPGTYDLYAAASPWLVDGVSNIELGVGEDREQDLVLAGGAGLEVRLVGLKRPLPRDFDLSLRPEAEAALRTDHNLSEDESLMLERGADGVWRGKDLPTGPVELMLGRAWIVTQNRNSSWSTPGRQEAVGQVELEASTVTKLELDLSDKAPGVLLVQVHRNGAPLPQVKVEVKHEEWSIAGVAHTDAEGRARIDGLFPATYTLAIVEGSAGVFEDGVPVRLEPAASQRVDVEVGGESAELRFVDDQGLPIAEVWIQLEQDGHRTQAQTDAEGRGSTLLLPGTYEVSYNIFDRDTRQSTRLLGTLAWPSGDEPPLEVVLAPREQ